MPNDSQNIRPSVTNGPDNDLFLKVYEEQFALLSIEAQEFCQQHFVSHTDLIPWILQEKDTKELQCNGKMRRNIAFFIAKIRIQLETAGYLLTMRQNAMPNERQKDKEDHDKWKEDLIRQAKNSKNLERGSNVQNDERQPHQTSKYNEWKWDSTNEEYLRQQYHNLICLFPHQVRKTIISIIPTLYDLREKTNEYTTFSSALRHKNELDQFIEIFRFIYNKCPFKILDIRYLYEQMTGRLPNNDLTLDESVTLRLLENTKKKKERKRLFQNHYLCPPPPIGYSHSRCINTYLIDPNNAVFCKQKETAPPLQLNELFCMATAYPDFIILAVTLVQAAKKVSNKLYALRRYNRYYDKYSIASLSETRIRMYASHNGSSFPDELYLINEGNNLYLSYDENVTENSPLNLKTNYFDELIDLEREFLQWLDKLRTILLRLSNKRLIVFSDFYKIKVFDKSNQLSCTIYTLISWIETHDIYQLAQDYHVSESPSDYHPQNFPGKYHY